MIVKFNMRYVVLTDGAITDIYHVKEVSALVMPNPEAIVLEFRGSPLSLLNVSTRDEWLNGTQYERSLAVLALKNTGEGWELEVETGFVAPLVKELPCEVLVHLPYIKLIKPEQMYVIQDDDPHVFFRFGIDSEGNHFSRLDVEIKENDNE